MRRFSSLLVAGTVAITLNVTVPVRAQSIVFDPNNYAQNVLTAARELQQINNQITSLQNQAQMLIFVVIAPERKWITPCSRSPLRAAVFCQNPTALLKSRKYFVK
jgi:hypothetical protein